MQHQRGVLRRQLGRQLVRDLVRQVDAEPGHRAVGADDGTAQAEVTTVMAAPFR